MIGNTATDVRCSAEDELCFRKNTACLAAAYIFGVSTHRNDGGRVTTLRLSNASSFTHNICSTVSIAAYSLCCHGFFVWNEMQMGATARVNNGGWMLLRLF